MVGKEELDTANGAVEMLAGGVLGAAAILGLYKSKQLRVTLQLVEGD